MGSKGRWGTRYGVSIVLYVQVHLVYQKQCFKEEDGNIVGMVLSVMRSTE